MRKIYLASSWRNEEYPKVLAWLRNAGHEVYDFRNPAPGNTGFGLSEIDREWKSWTPKQFHHAVMTRFAVTGFGFDMRGLDWADTCVLLLPCGRSAHLEAGYAIGQRKQVIILLADKGFEPELMYLMATDLVHSVPELLGVLAAEEVQPLHVRLVDRKQTIDAGIEVDPFIVAAEDDGLIAHATSDRYGAYGFPPRIVMDDLNKPEKPGDREKVRAWFDGQQLVPTSKLSLTDELILAELVRDLPRPDQDEITMRCARDGMVAARGTTIIPRNEIEADRLNAIAYDQTVMEGDQRDPGDEDDIGGHPI